MGHWRKTRGNQKNSWRQKKTKHNDRSMHLLGNILHVSITAIWRKKEKFFYTLYQCYRNHTEILLNQKQVLTKYIHICQMICCPQTHYLAINLAYDKIFILDSSGAHTEGLFVRRIYGIQPWNIFNNLPFRMFIIVVISLLTPIYGK